MNKYFKILYIIAIISVIAGIFCISSFAYTDEDAGKPYIESGDQIYFDIVPDTNYPFDITASCKNDYNSGTLLGVSLFGAGTSSPKLMYKTANGLGAYAYNNNAWQGTSGMRYCTFLQEVILTEQQAENLAYNSTYEIKRVPSPPPPPPHLEPSFWENVSGIFTETLNSGTAIVNWMTITPISLIPLALYCLIVIIVISKRLIKG